MHPAEADLNAAVRRADRAAGELIAREGLGSLAAAVLLARARETALAARPYLVRAKGHRTQLRYPTVI